MNGKEIFKAINSKSHYDSIEQIKKALYRTAHNKLNNEVKKEIVNKVYNIKECAVKEEFVKTNANLELPNTLNTIVSSNVSMEVELESGDSVSVDPETAKVLIDVIDNLDDDKKDEFVSELVKCPKSLTKSIKFAMDCLNEE